MPIATWAHSGGDFATTGVTTFSLNTSPSPAWQTAGDAWIATDDENGDTGTIVATSDGGGGAGVPFVDFRPSFQLENDSSIDPAETCNTLRITFDWAITNGPMGTATVGSSFLTDINGTPDTHGPGLSTGTYDASIDGATLGTPTMGDVFFFFGDPGGLASLAVVYTVDYTAGTFSACNLRLAISNLRFIIDYGVSAPVVTNVSPSHGDRAGGTVVTLTGTGFTGTTTATFNGSSTLFTPSSDTSGTCVTPAHAVGEVTVVVS
jgi:hypothetical protein